MITNEDPNFPTKLPLKIPDGFVYVATVVNQWKLPTHTLYYFVNYETKQAIKVWPVFRDYESSQFELADIIGWLGRDFVNGFQLRHVNKNFLEKIEKIFKNAIDTI